MALITFELGIREFRVPESNAELIDRIAREYSAVGMGKVLIIRHLIKFTLEDLQAFRLWRSSGEANGSTERFVTGEDFTYWHLRFMDIAEQMTQDVTLRIPRECSC